MRQIEKEAYIWADREIMTFEQAEDYIRMRARLRDASESLRRSFGIHDRAAHSDGAEICRGLAGTGLHAGRH